MQANSNTGKQAGRQPSLDRKKAVRHAGRQSCRQTYINIGRHDDKQSCRQAVIQAGR